MQSSNSTRPPKKIQRDLLHLKGEDKAHYDRLMRVMKELQGQAEYLSDDALSSSKESGGELSSMSTHMADRGSDNSAKMLELGLLTDKCEVIEMIEEALQRLLDGNYGKCMDCGCVVSDKRLQVIPYARFCVKCETIRESNSGKRPDLA